ncbi:hypothetical protein FDA09_10425 [Clostridium botulinum]|uniref:hypothetical protein n=1 Tax=Clostridium botulinum TaxID=1491 RepID=UPI00077389E9|nr:hypothetical protein [Clostridium botulinum]NFH80304.1 hypothetical protein [Clostridium botulinum]NFH83731.1 hypothetical protein [Clostridium botulinum]NFI11804.1 hypothetical protein [Clostridium botulinum]NFI16240.1 hypothetical protein [Clostridium botulinum]NFO84243.1 hypothetical protein [Clostridium botulinum]
MKTLIIYDNVGYILMQQTGSYRVPEGGIQYLEVDSEVHKNKIIKFVNIETKELVLEDIPKSDVEKLKEQVASLEKANAELTTLVSMQGQNA